VYDEFTTPELCESHTALYEQITDLHDQLKLAPVFSDQASKITERLVVVKETFDSVSDELNRRFTAARADA
jgi:hypothetical protein